MSATDGSPTKTGWKRRSSAASFSMCLRYSSSVVAPIGAQLAAGEHRLQHVGRVDRALGRAGADDRVQLVDEEDDLALGRLDLVEHGLEPLLELAAVLRAGEERADVERPDALALEPLRDVAGDDALGQPLGDRRLPDAGLADQHRVVLRAAREHLDHAADLLVAADDRVELALLGERGQVAAELLERLVGLLRILRRDALAAADVLDPRSSSSSRGTTSSASSRCSVETYSSSSFRASSKAWSSTSLNARETCGCCWPPWIEGLPRSAASASARERRGVGDELLRQLLVEEREQQVLGIDLGVAHPARELLRGRRPPPAT